MSKPKRRTRLAGRVSKAPSIYDVAREAKVSVFTVSAVINDNGGVSATLSRRVEAAIRKLHPYSVPEIIAWPIERGLAQYLHWVERESHDA